MIRVSLITDMSPSNYSWVLKTYKGVPNERFSIAFYVNWIVQHTVGTSKLYLCFEKKTVVTNIIKMGANTLKVELVLFR